MSLNLLMQISSNNTIICYVFQEWETKFLREVLEVAPGVGRRKFWRMLEDSSLNSEMVQILYFENNYNWVMKIRSTTIFHTLWLLLLGLQPIWIRSSHVKGILGSCDPLYQFFGTIGYNG